MNQPKAPDSVRNWNGIDIYLFTNGHHVSPPRKYHLRTEELTWWQTTLSHLARAQYGSMHSVIDLYTTDGIKVDNPMQLVNGSAYVAVTPLEHFIPAGYNEYLIKASRSWEKRQARKSSIIDIKPGDITVERSKSDTKINVTDTLIAQPDATGNIDKSVVQKIGPKLQSTLNSQQRKSSFAPIKPVDKKRPSVNQRISVSHKSYVSPIITPFSSKRPSLKKNLKLVPEKLNARRQSTQSNIKSVTSKTKAINKGLYKVHDTIPITPNPSEIEDITLQRKTSSSIKMLHPNILTTNKSQITDHVTMKNIIDDKDIIMVSNIFKNPEKDIPSLPNLSEQTPIIYEVNKAPSITKFPVTIETITDNVNERLQDPTKIVDHVFIPNVPNLNIPVDSEKEKMTNTSSKIKVINVPSHYSHSVLLTEKPITDQYTAVVNKGDVINLKLQIEVKGCDDNVSRKRANIQKIQSLLNYVGPEKGSQVNFEDEIFIQSNSFGSMYVDEYIQSLRSDGGKIIYVQCGCCDRNKDSNVRVVDIISKNDSKKYLIVVPTHTDEEISGRCKCDEEVRPSIEKEVIITENKQRVSDTSLSKKLNTTVSVEALTKAEEILTTTGEQNDQPIHIKSNTSQVQVTSEVQKNGIETERRTSNISANITTISGPKLIPPQVDPVKWTVVERRIFQPIVSDKSTQTDWCNVLLEARLHEDGRYSFHLPPLDMLRFYKL